MPGQKNWIFLLLAGTIVLLVGVTGMLAGDWHSIAWLGFGGMMLVGSLIMGRRSRRFVRESMQAARDDLRRESSESRSELRSALGPLTQVCPPSAN